MANNMHIIMEIHDVRCLMLDVLRWLNLIKEKHLCVETYQDVRHKLIYGKIILDKLMYGIDFKSSVEIDDITRFPEEYGKIIKVGGGFKLERAFKPIKAGKSNAKE